MSDNTTEVRARGIINYLIKSGKVEKRACEICGSSFKPIFGRKYCSDECRRKARLVQKREEYSRHKDRYAKNFKKYKLKLKERKQC